ncbi:general secretion pathway protein F [Endobacter medicaginis]|uniref:General secretion pathway protein F n=3 Tax=Endobacter medicaginis TaxID=1181271 RepID=A0A839UZE6_9PROT|nr:type II secretion system F family protein [Endobacter medicaginis]MBB3172659.1 general secretion pathway protein F [Endobacter medicaginis]MCX5475665.1 type II secretion system F family protein [Endobacter medicaginis]
MREAVPAGLVEASFHYRALTADGRTERGRASAPSAEELARRLQAQGRMPLSITADRGGVSLTLPGLSLGSGGLSRSELAHLTRELSIMLGAGQDLDRALRFLIETTKARRPREVLGRVRAHLRDGGPLSGALAREPGSFSRLYVGMVRAGEAGGTLGPTLDRLASVLERERALSASVQSAMIYPTLLIVAAIGSIGLLLTQVLPQFVPLFAESGAELPASTRFVIALGAIVGASWLPALVVAVAAFFAGRALLARPGPRLAVDRWRLGLPLLGPLWRETMAARLARTLGTMLLNGVPLVAALGIVRDALGNAAGTAAIDAATTSARAGSGLARPLAASGLFPERTIHLLALGEETAQLGAMALRAADIHEEAVRLRVQRLVALLVPAITIVMGAAIAGIVSSLLVAMLSLNNLAQ